MYSKRIRSSYRTYIRRRRIIFFAAALVIAGAAMAAGFQVAWRFANVAKGERKEILRLWEAGLYEEVYGQSQTSLAARPLDYFLLTMHGFAAYQLGVSQINSLNAQRYFDDCLWALRKALLLKDAANDGRLYYVLGKAYNYKGESYADLSVKYLEMARDLSYNAEDIPEYLGLAYVAMGDYRSSVAAFAEALAAQSTRGDDRPSGILLLYIARSYFALEEFDQARAYLQRCIDVSPDSRNIAEAYYQLGELYVRQGDAVRARAEWRLAINADPEHREARRRLSM